MEWTVVTARRRRSNKVSALGSRFLQLPLELRLLVYNFVLDGAVEEIHIAQGSGKRLRGLPCFKPEVEHGASQCLEKYDNSNWGKDFLALVVALRLCCKQV